MAEARWRRPLDFPHKPSRSYCAFLGVKGLFCLGFGVVLSSCSFFTYERKPLPPHFHYTVQKGETLYVLGKRFNVGVATLIKLNDIDNPRKLRVGQLLRVPASAKIPNGSQPRPETHRSEKPDVKSVRTISLSEARKYVGKLASPVRGANLSSLFGSRWSNFHEGLDFTSRLGAPIYAAHDGTVVYSDDQLRGYGNLVIIRGDGLLTVYAHNRKNLVRQGAWVRKGQQIAEMGKTGKATGVHLHFETRIKNADGKYVAVDPLAFFPTG